jgi:DnaJ-class molecular chaperone
VVNGKGFPIKGNNKRGNLIVSFDISFPEELAL